MRTETATRHSQANEQGTDTARIKERDHSLAQRMTFHNLGLALLRDVGLNRPFPTGIQPLSRHGSKGFGLGIEYDLAPLSRGVAKTRLEELGLGRYIELNPIATTEQTLGRINGFSLPTDRDIITSYQWIRTPLLVGQLGTDLQGRLEHAVADAKEAKLTLVELHRDLAKFLTRPFRHRGASNDVLEEIAAYYLVRGTHFFDWLTGNSFNTYIRKYIEGGLRNFFRDEFRSIRAPRFLYEADERIGDAEDRLLGKGGKVIDGSLAEEAGIPEELVTDVLLYRRNAMVPVSLDQPDLSAPESKTIGDGADENITSSDFTDSINGSVALTTILKNPELAEKILGNAKTREILILRFWGGQTQSEIGNALGISQMHVSRLLSQGLDRLRTYLEPDLAEDKES